MQGISHSRRTFLRMKILIDPIWHTASAGMLLMSRGSKNVESYNSDPNTFWSPISLPTNNNMIMCVLFGVTCVMALGTEKCPCLGRFWERLLTFEWHIHQFIIYYKLQWWNLIKYISSSNIISPMCNKYNFEGFKGFKVTRVCSFTLSFHSTFGS